MPKPRKPASLLLAALTLLVASVGAFPSAASAIATPSWLNPCPEPSLPSRSDLGDYSNNAFIKNDLISRLMLDAIYPCTELALPQSGSLLSPLSDPVLTSGFGMRTHPIHNAWLFHTGIDLTLRVRRSNTPITAVADGAVIASRYFNGYGRTVVLLHGGQMATLYAHLNEVAVKKGDFVTAGEFLGTMGQTGTATGPHLHFELRLAGAAVNPREHLRWWQSQVSLMDSISDGSFQQLGPAASSCATLEGLIGRLCRTFAVKTSPLNLW